MNFSYNANNRITNQDIKQMNEFIMIMLAYIYIYVKLIKLSQSKNKATNKILSVFNITCFIFCILLQEWDLAMVLTFKTCLWLKTMRLYNEC